MKRRKFLRKAGIGAAVGIAASSTIAAPNVIAAPKVRWRMVTTWPPKFPIFQTELDRFAKQISLLTDGQFNIQIYAGGELIPPLGAFDAVSKGTVQAGSGAAYYWAGKSTAAQWFAAVPFGMNAQGMNSWFYAGDGLKLWEEVYAPFNLIPRPIGNTGVQMGGWFNKEIKSIKDFKGLKMRIPGLGGKVLSKVGGTPVLLPGGEIFTSLERGVIDATEFVGPYHDMRLGLQKAAKFYYTPGWHEPGTVLEVFFNSKAYNKLPKSFQVALDVAAAETNSRMLAEFDAQNGKALETLNSKYKVKVKNFPDDVMSELRKVSKKVLEEESNKTAISRKVHKSFSKFKDRVGVWGAISEKSYFNQIA